MNKIILGKILFTMNNSKSLYSKKIEACANSLGLTKSEADILLFFGNNPKYTNACDAVVQRKFSKAYVSKALSSLYNKKLISITSNEKDKRYQQISLTESSNKTLKELQKCQEEYFSSLTSGISKEDFNIFLKVIKKIMDNYSKQ